MAKENLEALEALQYLENAATTERAKALLTIAKDKLMTPCVKTGSTERSAIDYARQLFCVSIGFYDGPTESLLVAAIGVAWAEAFNSSWNYGSEALYDLREAGIPLTMEEAVAIAAAPVNWNDPNKWGLLHNHALAAAIYCANVIVWNFAYKGGASSDFKVAWDGDLSKEVEKAVRAVTPYIGDEKQVRRFYTALVRSDFFTVNDGELVYTTLRMIENCLRFAYPADAAEQGKVILAAICSNLWQISWSEDNALSRDDGGVVIWDPTPLGPGRKSAFLAGSFFGKKLGKDVAEALDAYLCDNIVNPQVVTQFAENKLAIWLHLAWVLTSNEAPAAESNKAND